MTLGVQDSGKTSSLYQRVNRKRAISFYVLAQHLPQDGSS